MTYTFIHFSTSLCLVREKGILEIGSLQPLAPYNATQDLSCRPQQPASLFCLAYLKTTHFPVQSFN